MTSSAVPVIEGRKISKHFGKVVALENVDIAIWPDEIVGLVGDNGAGKSTLVQILSGSLSPSSGEIYMDGQRVVFHSPIEARSKGIETVYQDLSLALDLSVSANIFLGRELKRKGILGMFGWLDQRQMNVKAKEELEKLKITIGDITSLCESLSGGQRQAVAVARAIAWGTRVVLMDEPTAALGVEEQKKVADLILEVRKHGIPVLLISHNLPQVHALADRIVVLRRGHVVANVKKEDSTIEDIVAWITGAAQAVA
jgi:ABC-type sugar transport system ATPase subunit